MEVFRWNDGSANLMCATGHGGVERLRLSFAGDRLIEVTINRTGETPTSQISVIGTSDCQ